MCFFFFKQKTAYEMRISDWSSDVCSSDLSGRHLWIVTNAHRDSWQLKLEHTGFRHYFERVISSHDFGYPKEDLRFWEAMRSAHDFDPQRSLFVDDSMPVLSSAEAYGIAQVIDRKSVV